MNEDKIQNGNVRVDFCCKYKSVTCTYILILTLRKLANAADNSHFFIDIPFCFPLGDIETDFPHLKKMSIFSETISILTSNLFFLPIYLLAFLLDT